MNSRTRTDLKLQQWYQIYQELVIYVSEMFFIG